MLLASLSTILLLTAPQSTTEALLPMQLPMNNAFTGKINTNRVRLRLQPTVEAQVIQELSQNDFLLITGEQNGFYSVQPSRKNKGYIYRTFVLDGIIEGQNVNVRLEPDITSPVITKLNSGDKIAGLIAAKNNKWLEITLPPSVQFYVSREFVERIGDYNLYNELIERQIQLDARLKLLETESEKELSKTFRKMHISPIAKELERIIQTNPELTQQVDKAKQILQKIQAAYLQKGVSMADAHETIEKIAELLPEQSVAMGSTKTLQGCIQLETHKAHNVPGEFVLINPVTNLPEAYLSSHNANLQNYVGKEVSIVAVEKSNNNFAYPAYSVLAVK